MFAIAYSLSSTKIDLCSTIYLPFCSYLDQGLMQENTLSLTGVSLCYLLMFAYEISTVGQVTVARTASRFNS